MPLMGLTSPNPRKQQHMHVADINTAPPFETGLPLRSWIIEDTFLHCEIRGLHHEIYWRCDRPMSGVFIPVAADRKAIAIHFSYNISVSMTAFIQSRELRKKRWIASTSILVLELRQLTRNGSIFQRHTFLIQHLRFDDCLYPESGTTKEEVDRFHVNSGLRT
ncbi:hypothetical protein T01_12635 [Trichinella spiralis]|uniref:Uncharacterized protein n=1 Tax=Trichinella spiralis TaxID=6334 RepID=A0A0V1BZL9_TRISP|nr:hypothetical protein T01_12635 [Trichinella spiralis]